MKVIFLFFFFQEKKDRDKSKLHIGICEYVEFRRIIYPSSKPYETGADIEYDLGLRAQQSSRKDGRYATNRTRYLRG